MKKNKFEERCKNAYQAFFDNEFLPARNAISLRNSNSLSTVEDEIETTQNGDFTVKLLKQVFLFLPGSWLLFMCSTFVFEAYIWQRFGGLELSVEQLVTIIFSFALYGFMTVFGLGSLRNVKHYLIPATIIGTSFLIVFICLLAPQSWQNDLLYFYSIYAFPLVLIITVLVKTWGNKKVFQ